MLDYQNSSFLNYATSSNAYFDFDELYYGESEDTEVLGDYDYSNQLDAITCLLIVIIFVLGVVSGLVFSKIMWGRIR